MIISFNKKEGKIMLISERIYKYLEEKNISQLEFSKRTGISQSTISDWRRKRTNPSADKIMIICDVLEVTPYDLLLGTENHKMKEYMAYKDVDYMVIHKDSKEYEMIVNYQNMDNSMQKRLESYMKTLKDVKQEDSASAT